MNLKFLISFTALVLLSNVKIFAQSKNISRLGEKMQSIKNSSSSNTDSLIQAVEEIARELDINSTIEDEIGIIIAVGERLTTYNQHQKALDYLTKLNERKDLPKSVLGNLYHILGFTFKNLGAHTISNKYYSLAIQQDSVEQNNFFIYGSIGINHLSLQQFDSASFYFKKQHTIAVKSDDQGGFAGSLNNTGWSFLKQEELDSSIHYFRKSVQYILAHPNLIEKDSFRLYNIYGNIGMYFQKKKEWDSAYHYLKKDFDYNINKGRNFDYMFAIIKELTLISFELDQLENAEKYLAYYNKAGSDLSTSKRKQLIELKIRYNALVKNTKANEGLISDYLLLNEIEIQELEQEMLDNNNVAANFILNEAKLESQLQNVIISNQNYELELAKSNQRSLLIWIAVAGLLLSLSIVVLVLFRRQSKLRTQLLSESKQLLEQDLKLKEQDLTNLALTINQKYDHNKDVLKKLTQINLLDEKNIKLRLQELIIDLKNVSSIDKGKQGFYQNFDTINAAFFEALNEKHPNLTKKEKELCALIRLGLNNKEISVMKNTTVNSVKVSKYRLKSKLLPNSKRSLSDYMTGF